MSAAEFMLRMVVITVLALVVGVMAVMGFSTIIEPFYGAFGEPSAALGWGEPGLAALRASAASFIGIFLVLVVYLLLAPIKNDVRQQVR